MDEGNRNNRGVAIESRVEAQIEAEEVRGLDSVGKDAADMRSRLADQLASLRFVNAALIVCVHALKQQAAEMDEEIALVLQRSVGDRLDETIDRIESIALGLEYEDA